MRLIIITGLSGAGKSEALRILEDEGFYTIANIPSVLITDIVNMLKDKQQYSKNIALIINTKENDSFDELVKNTRRIEDMDLHYEILFLEASDKELVKRYKGRRRPHPENPDGSIIDGIKKERKLLSNIKSKADFIVDTSGFPIGRLKEEMMKIFIEKEESEKIAISIISFGFTKGVPLDIDLLFDVRFIPNPYYIEELREKTGNDKEVRENVMSYKEARIFLEKLKDMIMFLVPYYVREGKSQLIIGIGCTGGKHRSVTIANELYEYLISEDYRATLKHREQED